MEAGQVLRGRRVVAVGGGHGLARGLGSLRRLGAAPTAVLTVADDGGSSGRLRRQLDIIALGDLRMALVTLARNRDLADLFSHRFRRGELEGHSLGNLALLAGVEAAGEPVAALRRIGELLDCCGRVFPATPEPVQLKARAAGQHIVGQSQVATASRIERVWLEPGNPSACAEATDAIAQADVVVLGPGSLFTSVIATLLVPELAVAVASTPATVVHVVNVSTQTGETSGFDVRAHLQALHDHVPGLRLDGAVVHDGPPPPPPAEPLGTDAADGLAGQVEFADVLARTGEGAPGHGHDPDRLAEALARLLARLR